MKLKFTADNARLWVAYGVDGLKLFNSTNLPQITHLRTFTTSDFPFI